MGQRREGFRRYVSVQAESLSGQTMPGAGDAAALGVVVAAHGMREVARGATSRGDLVEGKHAHSTQVSREQSGKAVHVSSVCQSDNVRRLFPYAVHRLSQSHSCGGGDTLL